MGQQEIHEHEAPGDHGTGDAGCIGSSQVTNGQGQDERRTAALDPLRPDSCDVTKGRLTRPL